MFFCNDTEKKCIPERWKCDSNPDCPNGYDEHPLICNTTLPLMNDCSDGFQCQATSKNESKCLSWDLVCDGKSDCPDGQDEGVKCIESCQNKEVKCDGNNQRCRGKPEGLGVCVCDNGFKMSSNSTCEDIDECNMGLPPCSQVLSRPKWRH